MAALARRPAQAGLAVDPALADLHAKVRDRHIVRGGQGRLARLRPPAPAVGLGARALLELRGRVAHLPREPERQYVVEQQVARTYDDLVADQQEHGQVRRGRREPPDTPRFSLQRREAVASAPDVGPRDHAGHRRPDRRPGIERAVPLRPHALQALAQLGVGIDGGAGAQRAFDDLRRELPCQLKAGRVLRVLHDLVAREVGEQAVVRYHDGHAQRHPRTDLVADPHAVAHQADHALCATRQQAGDAATVAIHARLAVLRAGQRQADRDRLAVERDRQRRVQTTRAQPGRLRQVAAKMADEANDQARPKPLLDVDLGAAGVPGGANDVRRVVARQQADALVRAADDAYVARIERQRGVDADRQLLARALVVGVGRREAGVVQVVEVLGCDRGAVEADDEVIAVTHHLDPRRALERRDGDEVQHVALRLRDLKGA